MQRGRLSDERGVTATLFALLLPVFLGMSAIVLAVGNWYTHARNLQTKVDAGALAGGALWSFPCGDPTAGTSAQITQEARTYVGPHMMADGSPSPYNAQAYNPQVGNPAPASKIHVVLNGNGYWTDASSPADLSDGSASTGLCGSMHLDVKATEDNTGLIGSIMPFFPDIKRNARVEIQQVEGLNGLLPIAVRFPRPLSAAAVFFNEADGTILDTKYFCHKDGVTGMPAGLQGWTSWQATNSDPTDPDCSSLASFHPTNKTGVAIATSFFPACGTPGATAPKCLDITGFSTVNDLCRQGNGNAAQCFYADPNTSGTNQNVLSGVEFIRGYQNGTVTNGAPELRSAWLDQASCTNGYGSGYFSAVTQGTCSAVFNANIDFGDALNPPNAAADVKYGFVYGDTVQQGVGNCPGGSGGNSLDGQDRPNCQMNGSSSASGAITFNPSSVRNSIVVRVRLKNTKVLINGTLTDCGNNFSATCQWFFTANGRTTAWPKSQATLDNIFANPVQRAFMGDIDSSGSMRFLRLVQDTECDSVANYIDAQAGSATTTTQHCFYLDMGLQGAIAKDQDEPPIQLNIGATSQSAVLDCDPNIPNLKDEIQQGCQTPFYAVNRFDTNPLCPPYTQFFSLPKAAPFDDWPPFRCVATQTTASPQQIMQGFDQRLFGVSNSPTCPAETSNFVKGRNYWHDANNNYDDYTFAQDSPAPARGNRLRQDDPRLITLFFTPYNSFTGSGNQTYPVAGFGTFYITGYGTFTGGGTLNIEDPCSQGNSDPSAGAGNKPPPDISFSNGAVVWGHFVKNVTPPSNAIPSGQVCKEGDFLPCLPVLVR